MLSNIYFFFFDGDENKTFFKRLSNRQINAALIFPESHHYQS